MPPVWCNTHAATVHYYLVLWLWTDLRFPSKYEEHRYTLCCNVEKNSTLSFIHRQPTFTLKWWKRRQFKNSRSYIEKDRSIFTINDTLTLIRDWRTESKDSRTNSRSFSFYSIFLLEIMFFMKYLSYLLKLLLKSLFKTWQPQLMTALRILWCEPFPSIINMMYYVWTDTLLNLIVNLGYLSENQLWKLVCWKRGHNSILVKVLNVITNIRVTQLCSNPDWFRLECENGKVSVMEGRLILVVLLSALNETIIWIVYTFSMWVLRAH